ncbi:MULTISPECIES: acetylxylan esterase [unclassified Streptomyces]|uniref:acetylxylan esterase n=1 Tax=unclassified Streptomyces TaxID=2593676 RepID=UPI00136EC702|nr:prolyl oligopeptidase family serine peptidase [Streptomyces sp. SID335]MYZ19416.1 prolyl oligopeptidase family serine peptidase [Streptomyces sp. SID337]NDZ85953.1 acetylxylan esterase [Streptomyces sp. SID10115]NEA04595.1 acetylxylan esterase [Streptomyces sp. SID10116]NEB42827.1 acetylxylan esterase [Streptomyces sp. SID339]
MPQFDLPLDELRRYRPDLAEPDDFDSFWEKTLSEARQYELDARYERVELPLRGVRVFDVAFAGFGGHPVKGWLVLPAGAEGEGSESLPVVVEYIGYGGGRGLPHMHLLWAAAGFAHFVMDTRGQGSGGWAQGDTPDPVGSGPAHPGFMTRGIEDPHDYYYRRLYVDAVRAVEAARSHPLVDETKVAVLGVSQGGGLALAVGGLVPDLAAVMADVPFLCDFPRATTLTDRLPYSEIGAYLKARRGGQERVFQTLSYFDGVHFAARGRAPALFSAALQDMTCPPSAVFAAYNAYAGTERSMEVYAFNDHEGGGPYQQGVQLRWVQQYLRS